MKKWILIGVAIFVAIAMWKYFGKKKDEPVKRTGPIKRTEPINRNLETGQQIGGEMV